VRPQVLISVSVDREAGCVTFSSQTATLGATFCCSAHEGCAPTVCCRWHLPIRQAGQAYCGIPRTSARTGMEILRTGDPALDREVSMQLRATLGSIGAGDRKAFRRLVGVIFACSQHVMMCLAGATGVAAAKVKAEGASLLHTSPPNGSSHPELLSA
jgi:hypothetical protein